MGKTEQEVVELLISEFEANITDPLNRSNKWIYDDSPRLDLAGFPRIAVVPNTSLYEQLSIGNTEQLEDFTIVVEVYAQKESKVTVGSTTDARGEQQADYLTKEVKNYIKNNHATWITNDLLHIIPETYTRSVVPGRLGNIVIDRITLRVLTVN